MRLLIVPALALALGGCAAWGEDEPKFSIVADTFCEVSGKISWSKADTRGTIDQVRTHNARHDALCKGAAGAGTKSNTPKPATS